MALGLDIQINQKFHLTIMPAADYQLFYFKENAPVGPRLIGFYGQLGIQYAL
jgi:hypothetical protein